MEYPYSDGKVLIEIDPHALSIIEMRNSLKTHFRDRADAYIAGSMAVYYRQGDPSAVVEPDVFVVLGAQHKEGRKSYLIWEEGGVVPSFVVDVAADLPGRRDATSKRATYERIGVREYWRFDPLCELIPDGLEGWRLEGGRYQSVQAVREAGWHRSEALALELRAEGWLLRFHDPLLGRDLLTHAETGAALEIAERRLDRAQRKEAERRAEAEATARLRVEREIDEANQRIRELEALLRLSDNAG